jgi:hypothetical protein
MCDDGELRGLVKTLLGQLPLCYQCSETATKRCVDYAGDMYFACEAHSKVGRTWGDDEDEQPVSLAYAETVEKIRPLL